jgi:hypothetical protein
MTVVTRWARSTIEETCRILVEGRGLVDSFRPSNQGLLLGGGDEINSLVFASEFGIQVQSAHTMICPVRGPCSATIDR